MAGNLKLLTGLAAGYVLGARAGRERYERIAAATRRLAGRPEVQQLAGKARGSLGAGLERAASSASDRLQQVRGEQGTATEPEPTAPQAVGSWSRESQAGEADSKKRGGAWPPAPAPSEGRRVRSRSNR